MITSRVRWICPGCDLPEWGKSLGTCHCGRVSVTLRGECFACHHALSATMVYKYLGRGLCGGCDWQHASASEQLALKTFLVEEHER